MNEFIKDQKALKTSRIFYFLFGGHYKEKYYPVNKGVNSLIEEKKSLWSWSCHSMLEHMCNKPELEFRP